MAPIIQEYNGVILFIPFFKEENKSEMRNKIFITEINREFEEVIEGCVRRVLEDMNKQRTGTTEKRVDEPGDIIGIDSACQLLGYSKATIYSKVSLNQIPFLARGKPLLFSKKSLESWIKAGRPKTSSITIVETPITEQNEKQFEL